MPDFGYMVPLEQRRRLAELYGDITEASSDETREGMLGNPRPIQSCTGSSWTHIGYDEEGFACLDEECPACKTRALIINEWESAECLTCAWRETEPPDPEPAPERCSSCGYLTSSIGHQITCGGQS